MANYSAIKAAVNGYIKANGRKEITGSILNAVLNATIDSLGRYFQFAGGAMPSDDPGTPDQNVCYLATEPGLYIHFGNIRINNEEVALLFWNGEWVKQTIAIGIQEVNASVDNQVGTPSVDVNYSNGQLVLTFHNLKGSKGDTGDPAGFGTIGADINGGVGTPGVSVETSGDNTSKNLMFHFTNLKGETGVTSVVATIDNTSGIPSCQVSLVNGVLTLAFSGLKGLQGNTGSSVDYPFTIVNNLTTDDPTQALSAAMGVQLEGEISQLDAKVNEIKVEIDGVGILVGEDKPGYVWNGRLSDLSSPSYLQRAFQVSNGANIRIQAEIIRQNVNTAIPAIAFVEDYVAGATATVIYQGGDSASTVDMHYTPTSDGYVIVLYSVSGAVKANGLTVTMEAEDGGIKEQLQAISQETENLETRVEDVEDYLKVEKVVPITAETKYGYVWGTTLSLTEQTTDWVQKAFPVNAGDSVNITCQVTQQNANVPSIAFVENYVTGETATILRDSTTGSANVDFVAPANGYVIVLYSVYGAVKADNLKVVKTVYVFPDKQPVIKIKAGGGGDYDNFRDAFDYINAHPNNDGYLVEVYPGEYDVLTDYTAEEINAASYSATGDGFCGIYVKNTHIKGIGHKEEIIINGYLSATDYSTEVRTQISTLNVDGNCTIENVTVTSDNLRYTIHDDFNDSAECTHIYKDCILINYHSTNGVTKSNCIGIGTKSGMRIVVDSCRLNSTIGYHNGGNFTSADEVNIINTRVEDGIQLNDTDSGVDGKLVLVNSFCAYITHNVITASPHISITVIGDANFPIVTPTSSIYKHDGVSEKAKSMYMAVGKCSQCGGSSPLDSVTTVNQGGYCNGVCIGIDGNTAIIQNSGWVGANHLGSTDSTSWAVGDFLGVGASGYLVPISGNDRAFAVVDFIYNGEPYIKIL